MTKLMRLPAVLEKTGHTRSRLYDEISAGRFPAPVKIGARAVAWPEADVDEWIAERIAAREAVAA